MCVCTNLLEGLPVVHFLSLHHFLQLLRLEELHQVHVTHLEESLAELLKHALHRRGEGVANEGVDKLFPVRTEINSYKNIQLFFN